MAILSGLVVSLAIILHSFELSLPFDCLPNGAPIPGVPCKKISHSPDGHESSERIRCRSPPGMYSAARHSSTEFHLAKTPQDELHLDEFPPAEFHPFGFHPIGFHPIGFHSGVFPPARPNPPERISSPGPSSSTRCMVPPTRLPSSNKNGYGLEYLPFIRLISRDNPNRIFELRRYTFPNDTSLRLRTGSSSYDAMPTQQQIVISTSDGEVFAILETTYTLAGLYRPCNKRAKINMKSGKITLLTTEEINDNPVGPQRPILKYFRVKRL